MAHQSGDYIFCDLDGTLIRENSLKMLIAESKHSKMKLFGLLLNSKFKRNIFKVKVSEICQGISLKPTVNSKVLQYILINKNENTKVFLATAAEYSSAEAITKSIYKFDGIIGTNEKINNKGMKKLRSIQAITNGAPFTYIGDSRSDLIIWRKSTNPMCVENKKNVIFLARLLRIDLEVV